MKNRSNIENFLHESHNRSLKDSKEHTLHGTVLVSIVHALPENVDIRKVLHTVENSIPEHLVYGVDSIYVEHLEDFDKRNVNALFKNGAIYVTNFQDDEEDMVDDIVHEIAHSVEALYKLGLYQDSSIVNEFLGKKKRMLDLLKQEGYNIGDQEYNKVDYCKQFDDFLYKQVGYSTLSGLTRGLFLSPYSTTSVREYFAIGFENYFLKDKQYVKTMCPKLYSKITKVSKI